MTVLIHDTNGTIDKWTGITSIIKTEGWFVLKRNKEVVRQCAIGATVRLEVL